VGQVPIYFGEWLKRRRKTLDLTQAELAEGAGCSVFALRKIESGERRPSKQLAGLLAQSLEIPPEEQATFIRVARGELNLERLPSPGPAHVPVPTPAPKPVSPPKNLPVMSTALVGREAELASLKRLLSDPNCRLLTLVGPGGIGKSRLALEVACRQWEGFAGGVHFVSLAGTSSPEFMVPAIAQAVGLNFAGPAEPRSQLVNYLSNKQALLLLDNLEHLLEGVDVLAALLASAPGLKLLVTSRERLELSGEWVFEVEGLAVPPDGQVEGLESYSAVQLFLQRARQARVDFELSVEDCPEVVRICRLVEGMPLAIELAAAWVPVLTCAEIADEIERGLDILATRLRDIPERQRSLRAVFEHSWQLLREEEQRAVRQLAVFHGGFSREAAEVVTEVRLEMLRSLTSKSFLSANQEARYGMHELLHQFSAEQLEGLAEAQAVRDTHSRYFLHAVSARQPDLEGGNQLVALGEIAAEFDNCHAAWDWAVQAGYEDQIIMSVRSLHLFFNLLSRYYEGIAFFRSAVTRFTPEPGSQPGLAWRHLVPYLLYIASITGTATKKMKSDVELCLELARAEGERSQMADCLAGLALYAMFVERDISRAILLGEQSVELFRAMNDLAPSGWLMLWLSSFYEQYGRPDLARAFAEESLDLALKTGNKVGVPFVLNNFALIAISTGDYTRAEQYYEQALDIAREMRHLQTVASAQTGQAVLHLFRGGELDRARFLAEESVRIGVRINFPVTVSAAQNVLSICANLIGEQEPFVADSSMEKNARNLRTPLNTVLSHWARALGACCGDSSLAWEELKKGIRYVCDARYPAMATWLLPVAAILRAGDGQFESATELLALASTHPLSPTGWMEHWSLLEEWRARLKEELSSERYQMAWNRGQALELEQVVLDLLED
jgi:predicted ATPase/DNA-binding XRE family transcriptional regulator